MTINKDKSVQKWNGSDWREAERALSRDPVLRKVIARVGPCTMSPRKGYYLSLCKAVFSQQLSTKVAAVLFGRFLNHFPRKQPTPALVLAAIDKDETLMKACGLSRQKQAYLRDLSAHFVDNRIPTRRLQSMTDDEVIEALTAVKGVGRWTAEMFLMFVLSRPDVWPVDDLGLRRGVQMCHGMKEMPTAKQCIAIGEKWRPWRSVATWYMWRGLSAGGLPTTRKKPADVKKPSIKSGRASAASSGKRTA